VRTNGNQWNSLSPWFQSSWYKKATFIKERYTQGYILNTEIHKETLLKTIYVFKLGIHSKVRPLFDQQESARFLTNHLPWYIKQAYLI
jgi:hypothetical protein